MPGQRGYNCVVRTRFAPSPTGRLHLGHAYAAWYARHLAEENGGRFLLRFEDIDTTRVRAEYYGEIGEDLRWLGLDWQGTPLRQLDRLDSYSSALEELRAAGAVYPCFCTRREIQEEVDSMANAPHGPEGALYPGTCKKLTDRERAARLERGDAHAWRLDAARACDRVGGLTFTDHFHGTLGVDPGLLGDVVLARKDIATSYHLAVVVDDACQQITHVTRGEDLLPSTHVHRILQELLGLPEPAYHHHPLVLDAQGKRLAKRHDSLSIRTLREQGKSPAEVLASFGNPGS